MDGSIHFIFMDWRHMPELLTAGREVYTELKNLCVWTKNHTGMGAFYRSRHELVFVFKYGSGSHRNNIQLGKYGRDRTNVWTYPSPRTPTDEGYLLALHPTVKPVALVADAIMDCSARCDIVLDSFLGSGTTVIAAQRTGRRCHGIEIDSIYVDAIVRRWQEFTRDTAHHALSGKTFDEPSKNRTTILNRTLNERVVVTDNGKRKSITKQEAHSSWSTERLRAITVLRTSCSVKCEKSKPA